MNEVDEEQIARLERKGAIRRGTGDFAEWLKTHPPIKIPGGAGVVQALLEELSAAVRFERASASITITQ